MLPRTATGWVTAIIVLLGVLGLARLGVWQLDRHAWKQAREAEILARHDLPPLGEEALGEPGEAVSFRRATLSGRFSGARFVLVAGQYRGGVAGYRLVQPLELPGRPEEPLVDRGWIPREGHADRVAALAGPATVTGLILDAAPFDAAAPSSGDGLRWTSMAPSDMARALGAEAPGWFLTAGAPEGSLPSAEAPMDPPVTGYSLALPGRPHLEYAGTWFLLSLTLATGSLLAARARGRSAARSRA